MADDKLNQGQNQTPEEVEKTTGEMNENDLEQVSGGMLGSQQNASASDIFAKQPGNLVYGDGKNSQIGGISSNKGKDQVKYE